MRIAKWQALGNHFLTCRGAALADHAGARAAALRRRRSASAPTACSSSDARTTPTSRCVVHNRDGSIAEVSGNGTRIAAAYAAERLGRDELRGRTPAPGAARRACSPTAASP